MKRIIVFAIVAVLLISSVTTVFVVSTVFSANKNQEFYVGVTFCGNSVSDAKQLIDKVKNYTNLFILQSGSLQTSNASIDAIGDYAVNSGLNFIAYMGVSSFALGDNWLTGYNGRWGNHFLGIYLDDEPGGKMLDGQELLLDLSTQSLMTKTPDGTISNYQFDSNNTVSYMRDGSVQVHPLNTLYYCTFTLYSNGSMTAIGDDGSPIALNDSIRPQYTYEQLWNACPIKTPEQAADLFVNHPNRTINIVRGESNSVLKMFTSDYALQWFDYQSGYDVVLTEFGSNQSEMVAIAQARGAANVFGKDWGAMITWKYTQAPYLENDTELYQQMCTAYENGAKYIAVFNYAPDMKGPYGTLTDDQFQALQRFWTEEVNNASVTRGQIKSDTAFMLPSDYGSGLRNQLDIIWGLWQPTPQDQQIWTQLQSALTTHGEKLDIVYKDAAHPATGKYSTIINQEPSNGNPNWLPLGVAAALAAAVLTALLFVRIGRKKKLGQPSDKMFSQGVPNHFSYQALNMEKHSF